MSLATDLESSPTKWREIAETYECSTCWAKYGEPCLRPNGTRNYELHANRTRQASNNGWRSADDSGAEGSRFAGGGAQGASHQRSAIPIRLD